MLFNFIATLMSIFPRARTSDIPQPFLFSTPAPVNQTVKSEHKIAFQQRQVTSAPATLALQACCGSACTTYNSLSQMVGLQCCGSTPINFFEKICCNGISFDKQSGNRYFDRCCDKLPFAWDQTCCGGIIFEGAGKSCCGSQPFDLFDRTKICCIDQLFSNLNNTVTPACCGNQMYDAWGGTQFCCGDKVYNTSTHDGCCVSYKATPTTVTTATGYNTNTQNCCDKVFAKTDLDGCCYVSDTSSNTFKPPQPIAYNTTTFCCDYTGVVRKGTPNSTCI